MDSITKKRLGAIGKLIHDLREERGITQSEFSKLLGTTQSAVARIESGEQNLSAATLSKISQTLGKDLINVSDGAINIQVEGGHKLSGAIATKTSKNCAMGLLCASLLNEGETFLKNVPRIEEVYRMIEILSSIGVNVKWNGEDLIINGTKEINLDKINRASAEKTRSVIMMIGPLVHKFKRFVIPHAGGCKLGARTVRPHFFAMENLGINIKSKKGCYEISRGRPKNRHIILYESGDTVTENVIMAAAKMPGITTIKYASANYQVQELCFFLEKLGIKIEGIGTTTLIIHGQEKIKEDITYYVSEDPIESMFMIAAAIVTKSELIIKRCPIDFLEIELLKLEKMGFRYKMGSRYKSFNDKTNLVDIHAFPSELKALHEKIDARPYPGLNIDNLPFFAVIATQAKGQTMIHDWVYEERAIYYKELDKLGADVILADPHRAYITGPTELKANEVICPPALRPAAIVLIGMLGARGVSTLRNIYSINRGYEDIIRRLNAAGAKIRIIGNI